MRSLRMRAARLAAGGKCRKRLGKTHEKKAKRNTSLSLCETRPTRARRTLASRVPHAAGHLAPRDARGRYRLVGQLGKKTVASRTTQIAIASSVTSPHVTSDAHTRKARRRMRSHPRTAQLPGRAHSSSAAPRTTSLRASMASCTRRPPRSTASVSMHRACRRIIAAGWAAASTALAAPGRYLAGHRRHRRGASPRAICASPAAATAAGRPAT